jgi:hypothetical protein
MGARLGFFTIGGGFRLELDDLWREKADLTEAGFLLDASSRRCIPNAGARRF